MSDALGTISYVEGTSARFAVALQDANGAAIPLVSMRLIVLAPHAANSFVNPTTEEDGQCVGIIDCTAAGLWRYRFESLVEPVVAYEGTFSVTPRYVPALVGPGGSAPSIATDWRIGELTTISPIQTSDQIAISRDNATYRTTLGAIATLLGTSPSETTSNEATPEQYGAVGDGESHLAPAYLGVTTLEELREWNGGIYAFAPALNVEMDYLGIQALWNAGGTTRGKSKSIYKIDRNLVFPNGYTHWDGLGCTMTWYDMVAETLGADLLVNPSFDSGSTGWTQGTLGPRTDIVFSGGKASFTDPAPELNASYGDFGQEMTFPGAGKWSIRVYVKLSDGASHGQFGPPYMNMGFRPDGVGLGSFDWPHPLSFGSAQLRTSPFEGWVQFDVETLEETTAWLDIQGGNCNWEVQEAHIQPYAMNYAIHCTGDDLGFTRQYDVSLFRGGEMYGPVDGNFEGGFTGPAIGGILHKSFRGEGARCSVANTFLSNWDVGITLSSQAFLNYHSAVNIVSCRTCIKFLANSTNAGENLRWDRIVLANSLLGLHAEGGGEWNFWGSSFDFCKKLITLEREAKVSMDGHHFEFVGSETRMAVTNLTGTFNDDNGGETITGGTSGATARLIIDRGLSYGHFVVEVLTGTFVDGETVSGAAGTAELVGEVEYGDYMFDIKGGSHLVYQGEFLQAGGAHRGALHMFNLETNVDSVSCRDWKAYGLKTASDTLCTGAGRFLSSNYMGPGNAQLPGMIIRNHASDIYAGNGRIYGPGSLHDMGYMEFANPTDDIGFAFGAYSVSAPSTRGLTAWEQLVSADSTVYTEVGYGSLKLEYNGAYSNYVRLVILVPVQPGDVVFDEYKISKPDAKTYISIGPFTSSADPNQIWVNTTEGSSIVTIQDNQATSIGDGYGPAAGWLVDIVDVTGDPGGIPNAVWNATHTIVERIDGSDVLYTIDLGAGNEATSTVSDAGGSSIETTYTQTNVLIFDARFWVQAPRVDSVGRPIIDQSAFQGEDNFRLSFDAVDWFTRKSFSHYTTPVVPTGVLVEDRYANGRAPVWATHYAHVISWGGIRYQDTVAPPPIYLTDFFGNKL